MQDDEGQDLTDGEGLDDVSPTESGYESGYVTNYNESEGDVDSDYFSGDALDDLEYCDDTFATEVTGQVSAPRCLGSVTH